MSLETVPKFFKNISHFSTFISSLTKLTSIMQPSCLIFTSKLASFNPLKPALQIGISSRRQFSQLHKRRARTSFDDLSKNTSSTIAPKGPRDPISRPQNWLTVISVVGLTGLGFYYWGTSHRSADKRHADLATAAGVVSHHKSQNPVSSEGKISPSDDAIKSVAESHKENAAEEKVSSDEKKKGVPSGDNK